MEIDLKLLPLLDCLFTPQMDLLQEILKMLTNAKLAFQNLRLILKSLWRLSSDNDKGLEIRCAPRVHQEKLSTITQQIPIEGAVLDLAAGSVAWLARL
jgi:hypothetical protein